MGAEGREPFGYNAGQTALSESSGPTSGPIASGGDSVAPLRQQALDALQFAWKHLRRLEVLSDNAAESEAAGRAVKHVDKAFAELERKTGNK